jgi:hypothetical protein
MKILVDVKEITWECGDCKDRYDYSVSYCPNEKLDVWVLKSNRYKKKAKQNETH